MDYKNKVSPCKSCTDKRELGCHATCEDYLVWKKEMDDYNDKVRKRKELDSLYYKGMPNYHKRVER